MFIAVFTRARHRSQSKPDHSTPTRHITVAFHLCLDFTSGFLPPPQDLRSKFCLHLSVPATFPTHLILLHPDNIWCRMQRTKLLVVQFSRPLCTPTPDFLRPNILHSALLSTPFIRVLLSCDRPSFTPTRNVQNA